MNEKMHNHLDKPSELLEKMFEKISYDQNYGEMPNFLSNMIEECQDLKIITTRTEELRKIIEILSRKNKANVILIGETGVGKTSLVEQLANKISKKQVPDFLLEYTIYSLDFNKLMSNTGIRGMYEEKINQLKNFLYNTKSIVFIDEIHGVFNHNKHFEPNNDLLSQLKTDLAKGKIRLIGTTTIDELGESIQNDPALSRRIQTVYIRETSNYETARIIISIKKELENYHDVNISDEAIKFCLFCCEKFITDKFFPDKAIEILDLSCSQVKLKRYSTIRKLEEIKKEKENINFLPNLFFEEPKEDDVVNKAISNLNNREQEIKTEAFDEEVLLAQFSDKRNQIEKIKEELGEIKEYNFENMILNEGEVLDKEEEKLNLIVKKIKTINPEFKAEITKEDIFETLENLCVIKKAIFQKNYFMTLSNHLISKTVVLEEQVKLITNSLENKFSIKNKIQKNKLFSMFFLIDDESDLTEELLKVLNDEMSFNNAGICYLNIKDIIINQKEQHSFWKQKINNGHRIFIIEIDKKNLNQYFFNQNKSLIKEGRNRNVFGTQCSFSGSIFFFKAPNTTSIDKKDETMSSFFEKEFINSFDDIIAIPKLSKIDKFTIFDKFMPHELNYLVNESLRKFIVRKESNLDTIKKTVEICKKLLFEHGKENNNNLCYDFEKEEIYING